MYNICPIKYKSEIRMRILSEREIRKIMRSNLLRQQKNIISEGKTVSINDRESFNVVRKPTSKEYKRNQGEELEAFRKRIIKNPPPGVKNLRSQMKEKLNAESKVFTLRYDKRAPEHYIGSMDKIVLDMTKRIRKGKIETESGINDYLKGCRIQASATIKGKNKKYKFPLHPEQYKSDANITNPALLRSAYDNYLSYGITALDAFGRTGSENKLSNLGNYDVDNAQQIIEKMKSKPTKAGEEALAKQSKEKLGDESEEAFTARKAKIDAKAKMGSYLVARSELIKWPDITQNIQGFEERYRAEPGGYEIIQYDMNADKKPASNTKVPQPENPKGTILTINNFKIDVPSEEKDGKSKKVNVPSAKVGMADFFAEVYAGKLLLKLGGKGADTTRVKNQVRVLHDLLKHSELGLKEHGYDPSKFTLTGETYSQATKDAVEAYQKAMKAKGIKEKSVYKNFTVDGITGKQTIASFDNRLKGKLIPITGAEHEYSKEDAIKIGLPDIANGHKEGSKGPKLYAESGAAYEFRHNSGKKLSKSNQDYLYAIFIDMLMTKKAPTGSYLIATSGEYGGKFKDQYSPKEGVVGNVGYIGKDKELFKTIKGSIEQEIFKPYSVEEFSKDARGLSIMLADVGSRDKAGPSSITMEVKFDATREYFTR